VTSVAGAGIEAYKAAIGSADLVELGRLLKADGAAVPRTAKGSTVLHLAASGLAWRDRNGAIAAVLAAGIDPPQGSTGRYRRTDELLDAATPRRGLLRR
jgi:hypothetical protein